MAQLRFSIKHIQSSWSDGTYWILECTYGQIDVIEFLKQFRKWVFAQKLNGLNISRTFVGNGIIRFFLNDQASSDKVKQYLIDKKLWNDK